MKPDLPALLHALRAAYANVCLNTGDGAPHPHTREWGLDSYPQDQSTWCNPQWVRELCEEAGVLDTFAVSGIWTPHAQVLCYPCHGLHGPIRDYDTIEKLSALRGCAPEGEEFQVPGKCDDCGTLIWLRSEVGQLAALRDFAATQEGAPIAELWQTGGMCSALCFANEGIDQFVVVSTLDGPFDLGFYENEAQWEAGECRLMFSHPEDTPIPEVFAAVANLFNTHNTDR